MSWGKVQVYFLKPSAGRALSALRIVVGAAMIVEAIRVFPYIEQLYGQYGFVEAGLIEVLTGAAIPGMLARAGLSAAAYAQGLTGFYVLHIFMALVFLVGWKTRAANIGLWLTQTVIINSGYLSSYGVDRYFHNLLFMMMWFPVACHWSVDRWRRGRPYPESSAATLGLRLLQIFILMTYINAGVGKSKGADWWSGEAIWRATNQPEFHHIDFLWLAQVPWLARWMGRGTMFIEAFYALGVWIPVVGTLWVWAIIGLHIGIALTMGLTLFGLTLAGVNAALFLVRDPKA